MKSIAPAELARRRAAGEDFLLLDVREPFETALCRIEGALLVPLSELRERLGELDPERAIVCVCHHGIRSARVAGELARLGFEDVYNLVGGIERWAVEVDPSMRRY